MTHLPWPPVLTEIGPYGAKVARNGAVIAAVLQGEAQKDIAARHGISPARVHQIFHRWRHRLWEPGRAVFVPFEAFDAADVWTPQRQAEANSAPSGFGMFRGAEDE